MVFMGHGNPEGMVDPFYREMSGALASADADFLLACVDGKPGFEDILPKIKSKRVWLIPFMVVAGDHAVNDLSGPEKDSWKSRLEAAGHECTCVLRGLGEVDAFAEYLVLSPRKDLP